MDRVTAANYVLVDGLRMFADPDLGTNQLGTGLNALFHNGTQEEIIGVIEAAGLTASNANLKQMLAAIQILAGIRLLTATTFYVNGSTGVDAPAGGTNVAPWKTINYALGQIAALYNTGGQTVTISYTGAGTASASIFGMLPGQTSPEQLIIDGNNTATLTIANGSDFQVDGGAGLIIQNFALLTTTGGTPGNCIGVNSGIVIQKNCSFGACTGSHMTTYGSGAQIRIGANYAIVGGAPGGHITAGAGSLISPNLAGAFVATVTGTPTFTDGFARCETNAVLDVGGITYSGAANGPRYTLGTGGAINTNGGGANFFPGSSAGTNDGTGSYS